MAERQSPKTPRKLRKRSGANNRWRNQHYVYDSEGEIGEESLPEQQSRKNKLKDPKSHVGKKRPATPKPKEELKLSQQKIDIFMDDSSSNRSESTIRTNRPTAATKLFEVEVEGYGSEGDELCIEPLSLQEGGSQESLLSFKSAEDESETVLLTEMEVLQLRPNSSDTTSKSVTSDGGVKHVE